MIHYQLKCGQGHAFDGWFKNSASFDQQAKQGLLACPACADTAVSRALMAPALRTARHALEHAPQTAEPVQTPTQGSATKAVSVAAPASPAADVPGEGPMPDQLRAFLQRMRAEIERKCEYVGPKFAEQARLIHQGEAPARPIYGEASQEQAEKLTEDGVGVARIPWVPRADS